MATGASAHAGSSCLGSTRNGNWLTLSYRGWAATGEETRRGLVWGAIAITADTPHMRPVPYHRFKVGQIVVASLGGPHALTPRRPHVIVRPLAGREPQYRIRSDADGLERVVLESQIRRLEETAPPRLDKPDLTKPGRRRLSYPTREPSVLK